MGKILVKLIPWLGMALLQSNAIPAVIYALENGTSTPIPTVLMTIAGLICYMVRAVMDKDILYMTGNLIGLVGNVVLLLCII